MRKAVLFAVIFNVFSGLGAQIISGPMLGPVQLRDATVWLEVSPTVKSVQLQYFKKGLPAGAKTIAYKGALGNQFNPVKLTVGTLDPNTVYEYRLIVDGKASVRTNTFTTKELWQWRRPAPDFSFLAGSCAYVNDSLYDRPGSAYGSHPAIFETMAKEKAAFMLWLGDNWYTREVDYYSQWGLWNRAQHDRRLPALQNLLKAMPHYATWDDHDFGPNDAGGNYILKEHSKKVFDAYWANPSSGQDGEGIYTMVSHSDVDLFLCDDRWWRSADVTKDSVNGMPNPDKQMLGNKQLQWLQNSLLQSKATFKIIVVGSQVLNPRSLYDKMLAFPAEYNRLTGFLLENKIAGALFFSGDRHHSEVIKIDRPGTYPLYDVTVSSLTAGPSPFTGAEKDNPYRVIGVDKNNYGRVSVTGEKGERVLTVEFIGASGDKLGEWSVQESALKTPGE